jgi:hypothetical protein
MLYKVEDLYEIEYNFKYKEDEKEFEYLKEKNNDVDIEIFKELKQIRDIKDYSWNNYIINLNFIVHNPELVREFLGFEYEIIPYVTRYKNQYEYKLVDSESSEVKIKRSFESEIRSYQEDIKKHTNRIQELINEVNELQDELETIKSKW